MVGCKYLPRTKAGRLVSLGLLLLVIYVPLAELCFHYQSSIAPLLAAGFVGTGYLLCVAGPFFTTRQLWWKITVGFGMFCIGSIVRAVAADSLHMLFGWG
jgi:hypothetical protein